MILRKFFALDMILEFTHLLFTLQPQRKQHADRETLLSTELAALDALDVRCGWMQSEEEQELQEAIALSLSGSHQQVAFTSEELRRMQSPRTEETEVCPRCGRVLPAANMLLHSTRCSGVPGSGLSVGSPAPQRAAWLSDKDLTAFEMLSLDLPTPTPQPLSREHSEKWNVAVSTGDGALRCRVSCDVEELEVLNQVYGWVPGAAHVRPSDDVRAQKALLLSNLCAMWASPADWVFHHIFGSRTTRGRDGKRSAARPPPGATFFAPNPFPYQVPSGTEHWVLWMASPESEWPEDRITAAIAAEVDERGGGQFVWYPNPKMSIGDPQLHHVQTFWRPAAPEP